ncbi:hypothetical protein [Actinokineospora globicatena]|nr:hypothetical protein [Actinokineospora globicatena]
MACRTWHLAGHCPRGVGRLTELVPGAAARADVLFAVTEPSWCGTFF